MASLAQTNANRDNAKLSTGPRTSEGKLTVSRNAVSHGLSGAHVILPGENAGEFDALLSGLHAEHASSSITERFLVEQMAHAQWKLQRIARMEAELLKPSPEFLAQCAGAPHDSRNVAVFVAACSADQSILRLNRYEAATRRAYFQALKQLMALQAARRAELKAKPAKTVAAAEAKSLPAQHDRTNYETKPISTAKPAPDHAFADNS